MASKADDMIDRRRLRRKLTFWRGAAIVIAAVAVIAAAVWMFQDTATSTSHIAKIRIEGTITDNRELQERIQRIGESASVQGVIVAISSPRRHDDGRRGDLSRRCVRFPNKNPWSPKSERSRPRPATMVRDVQATTSSPASPRSSVRSASWCSFPTSPN